jgi:exonuclease III
MARITTYLSVKTLNVSYLNSPIKRHRLVDWVKKEDPTICGLQETFLTNKDKHTLKVKGWKKIFQVNAPWKQAGVMIFIYDKVDFNPKLEEAKKVTSYW